MKLYTLTIPENIAPGRLFPWLRRMLPQLPAYAVRAALDRRDVKLNGKRVDRQAMLIPGAEVRLYTPGEEIREPEIPILYEDSRVLVVRKPAGISCQKDAKGGQTITELVARQLRRQESNAREPLMCHRLDNQTDGLLLLCRDEDAQTAMEEAFRQRRIHKRYLCLTKGTPQPDHAVLRAFLTKDSEKALVRVTRKEQPGSLSIVTEYTVLEPGPCARVEILLHTGRTHQIRAQMAAIGHPLLGDDKYGDREFNKRRRARRLMLCAAELRFELDGEWAYLNDLRLSISPEF